MENNNLYYYCKSCTQSAEYRAKNCFQQYKLKQFKSGDVIVYKGDEIRKLSLLVDGRIIVRTILDTGLCLTSRFRTAPFPIGAVSLFATSNLYRVEIIADTDCDVVEITKTEVENQMVKCRIFLRNFLDHNSMMMDVFSTHLAFLSQKNIKAKLALYILSKQNEEGFEFDKSLTDLAVYFCVERPSLSRAIAQLVEEDIITYNRGKGKIININALQKLIE